ncbi:MAG: hypothetical protein JWM88_623, partial [Verrucomicrobia bacterium]|nr:hypothetical protein [Verrucomicrobiota bacterium]
SIDMLDIRFRMEHAFGLAIEQNALALSLGEAVPASVVREELTVVALASYVDRRLRGEVTR